MSYNPTFNRPVCGKYNDESSFISIIGGSDAYLLEDEVNELQWIQIKSRTEMLKELCKNGLIKENDNTIYGSGIANNIIYINNFKFNVNGFIAKIYSDNGFNTVKLNSTPSDRMDFVFLEVYLKIIDFKNIEELNNKIYRFGGLSNDIIDYEMFDSRVGVQTSKRVQLQWTISKKDDINYISNNPFDDNEITSSITNNIIKKVNNVYFSETNENTKDIIDKCVYAFPLCVVRRTANKSTIENSDIIDLREEAKVKNTSDIKDSTIYDALNRIDVLEQRLNNLSTEITSDQKAYGLSMNKKTGIYAGSNNTINGTTITIDNYSVANNNYVVALTNLGNHYGGQIGEIWTWQDGNKYHVCNTGDENVLFNSFDFRNDNEEILKYGYVNSNGLSGVQINVGQSLNNCIIYVLPVLQSSTNNILSIGDIFIDIVNNSFYIYNTGSNNIRLQYFVLKINNKNIEYKELELNETTIVNDAFGKHHCKIYKDSSWGVCNILLGTPIINGFSNITNENQKINSIPNIGEIYIEQNKDVFMLNTTSYGNAKLRFAVFKTAYTEN